MTDDRVGLGIDFHRLVEGRPLVLGGVTVPFERGLLGHSDADVVTHAVCDALLGHLGMSGQMLLHDPGAPDERHLRVRFTLSAPPSLVED